MPPLSVLTSMLMANSAPSRGWVRQGSITTSRMAIRPPGTSACVHLGEQLAVVPPRMLVADGADPGEIGAAGQIVDVEIARRQRHPAGELRAGQPLPGLLDGVGQIEDRGRRRRARRGGRPASTCPTPRPRPADGGTSAGRAGRPDRRPSARKSACMAAMKLARSAAAPRMLACRGAGMPAFDRPGQLRPAAQDVGRRAAAWAGRSAGCLRPASRAAPAERCTARRVSPAVERGHGIQQHGRSPAGRSQASRPTARP